MHCRFLYLAGQLNRGGQERQLCNLFQAMDRGRYEPAVAVWTFREDDDYVSDIRGLGIPIFSLGSKGNLSKLVAFRTLVTKLKPEIVHSYSFWTNFAAFLGTVGTRSIPLGSVRGSFSHEKQNLPSWHGQLSSRWPRHHIFNSFAAAATARTSKSFFVPKHIHVVRNGLDLQQFPGRPVPAGKPASILAAGSLEPIKRWDRLIDVAAELKRRGFDFLLRIAGKGTLRSSLEMQARRLGIAAHVRFLGHIRNMPELLAETTLLAHSSDSEGCPNVVMEAMACGRPVVATDVGDVADLVKDGETGFVVKPYSQTMMVERMAMLISDHDLCCRMGRAGRMRAEREFGLDRLIENTLSAYRASGWNAQ